MTEKPQISINNALRDRTKKPNKGKNYYFTDETEASIIAYLTTEDPLKKELIYSREIHPAIDKLVEVTINVNKFQRDDVDIRDIKNDAISKIVQEMNRLDLTMTKGKAFSYLNTIAFRYLLQNFRKDFKYRQRRMPEEKVDNIDKIMHVIRQEEHEDSIKTFFDEFINFMENKMHEFFTTEKEILAAIALLELFKNRETMDNHSKRVIYFLVKDMTGVKTSVVTSTVSQFKKILKEAQRYYMEHDTVQGLKVHMIKTHGKTKALFD